MNKIILFVSLAIYGVCDISPNQTADITPILTQQSLPFTVSLVLSGFQLPSESLDSYGLQSFVSAIYQGKWLLLAGRTNGLHGFSNTNDNFPPRLQNTSVYVVDPSNGSVSVRSLKSDSAGLNQFQIDTLSATASQYYQVGSTLYVVGGYGVDTPSGQFSTKSTLTAIDIPAMISWVENDNSHKSAANCIRQTSHPLLQVTGGYLTQENPHQPFLLIFGQNFTGFYNGASNGVYTEQVRAFQIIDNGRTLYIKPAPQYIPNPNYRRRDLSVIPIMQKGSRSYDSAYVALSGVFTEGGGVWTVPVTINIDGASSMADPLDPNTFKQGMNNYIAPHAGLFSKKTGEMFTLLFGGLSYLTYSGGNFQPEQEIPFINSITTIKIDSKGNFSQYIMDNEYPILTSDLVNPGNQLLFGASARFFPATNLPAFSNTVFSFDSLGSSPVLLGYIVGGIQSTVANTTTINETSASPYIFSVILQRN